MYFFKSDKMLEENYLFYLSFENELCQDCNYFMFIVCYSPFLLICL